MDSSDISKVIIIFFIFLLINVVLFLSVGVNQIKSRWSEYKCNPVIMPFAQFFNVNPIKNFESCIQNVQNAHMSSLLDPVYNMMSTTSNVGGELNTGILGFSGILNLLKINLGNKANMAVEVIINILIELQHILIKFKDMINKLVGIFVTFIYLIAGTEITALTLWEALPGWLVREIAKFSSKI
jgi:hypothetical protein